MEPIRSWKKVYQNDLDSVVTELKDFVEAPAVIVLSGPVGAGKTTFTKHFIGNDETQSPTYSLVNEVNDFVHADFYRLKSASEIVHLELPLYLEDKDFFLVEWGRPYLRDLKSEVGEDFSFYEIDIQVNEDNSSSDKDASRNILLYDLEQD